METSIRVLVANRPRLLRELVLSTLSEQTGISIVGEADNEKDIPSLVAETKADFLLIALDESRRRPPMCDQLLRKHPGLGIIAVAPTTNFRKTLHDADLVVPDGFPLVWLGRRKGYPLRRRVYGPELMERFCEVTATRGYRHFFYGGATGVAEELAARLTVRFPGLQIAGAYCPPFRALTQTEDDEVTSLINCARADIVWVGLGAPKQERWMFEHRAGLTAPVLVGVGAAFDFHTGRMAQAPLWMREHGLEWLFRLSREPGRLWRLPHLRNTICRACLTRSSGPQEVSLIPVLCHANSYAKKGRRSCLLRPVDRAKITGPTVLYGS